MNRTAELLSRIPDRLRREQYRRAVGAKTKPAFVRFFKDWKAGSSHWPISLEYFSDLDLFRITDEQPPCRELYLARQSRVELYPKGVSHRLDHLWREYLVDQIDLREGDMVVDIGSNIGEFSLAARRFGAETFSIEPDPTEFRALSLNCGKEQVLNKALWSEPGELTFYSKNDSGDSSLIEIPDYSEKITVQTTTLDEVHRENLGSRPIKLLKIEAEGAEPEIISAASETLKATEYVTVDVGPERGLAQENTVVPVLEALSEHGFKLRRFGNVRFVMLLSR